MKIFLAHGVLGVFDELLVLTPAAIFIATLCLSWLRTFNVQAGSGSRAHDDGQQANAADDDS